jgi:predicted NBD/HSP70 family sugar kinase
VQSFTEVPVSFAKDTSAACVAELVAGRGRDIKSFLYLFVDTFVGGGLVIGLLSALMGIGGVVGLYHILLAQIEYQQVARDIAQREKFPTIQE